MKVFNATLGLYLTALSASSFAASLAVSPAMTATGPTRFIYCELQGSTPRYGFESGADRGTSHSYSGGAVNLSAYLDTIRLSAAPRDANEKFDNVSQQHTMNLYAFFQPEKKRQETYNVSVSLAEDLFGQGTLLSFVVSPEIDGKALPQVTREVKLADLKDFKIDFSDPEFHPPTSKSKAWVDEEGRKTYTLELHCRSF